MAQREIGLAAGEPPTTKGYTPTVFSELPKLLERAGPGPVRPDGAVAGPITGLFTVLVDGDDHNEPIADAVRGILDGHIVMERAIAERGRYPRHQRAEVDQPHHARLPDPAGARDGEPARASLAAYANMEELIRIGAYRAGSDAEVDRAIALNPGLEGFMSQDKDDYTSLPDAFDRLDGVLEFDRRMKWADQLIKLSNFELELLQTRLAEVVDRRTRCRAEAGGAGRRRRGGDRHRAHRSRGRAQPAAYREGLKQRKAAVQREIDLAVGRGGRRARGARPGVRDAEEVRAGGRERPGRPGARGRPPRDRRARRDGPEARRGAAGDGSHRRAFVGSALALAACGQRAGSQPPGEPPV